MSVRVLGVCLALVVHTLCSEFALDSASENALDAAETYARAELASRNLPHVRFNPAAVYTAPAAERIADAIPPALRLCNAHPSMLEKVLNVYIAAHFFARFETLGREAAAVVQHCAPCHVAVCKANGAPSALKRCAERCVQLHNYAAHTITGTPGLFAWFLLFYVFGSAALASAIPDAGDDATLVNHLLMRHASAPAHRPARGAPPAAEHAIVPLFDVSTALAGSYALSLPALLAALDITHTPATALSMRSGEYAGVPLDKGMLDAALGGLAAARIDVFSARVRAALAGVRAGGRVAKVPASIGMVVDDVCLDLEGID